MTIKQDLKALQKEFKALEKQMEKLVAAAEKSEDQCVSRAPLSWKGLRDRAQEDS